jgi:hypothetical protein
MSPAKTIGVALLALWAWVPSGVLAAGQSGPKAKISVTLFGQPCSLEGPLTQAQLKAIHSVSPEEICSPFSSERTPDETRKAIERLKGISGLPGSLDRYRDRLARRLNAELAFLESMQDAKKSKNAQSLVENTKDYILTPKRKEFDALAKAFVATEADSAKRKELGSQLFDFYNDAIDASPEDEFHRAIRTMNVQYTCSFEESEEGESE